jgi:RHS repeat-associated protein
VSGEATTNRYRWTGREDEEMDLYYLRGRYYSQELHRFISRDPIGFAGGDANLYSYVGNSPTNLTDPLGLESTPQNIAGNLTSTLSGSFVESVYKSTILSAIVGTAMGIGLGYSAEVPLGPQILGNVVITASALFVGSLFLAPAGALTVAAVVAGTVTAVGVGLVIRALQNSVYAPGAGGGIVGGQPVASGLAPAPGISPLEFDLVGGLGSGRSLVSIGLTPEQADRLSEGGIGGASGGLAESSLGSPPTINFAVATLAGLIGFPR